MVMVNTYVRLEVKDDLIDLLLANGYDDFFFTDVKKYAAKKMLHSNEEQVTGRQNYAQFTIYLEQNDALNFINIVEQNFQNARIFSIQCQSSKL